MEDSINPDLFLVIAPIHAVALLLTITSNVSNIAIIIKSTRLHTPSYLLMMFLALSDLTLSLVWNAIPLAVLDEDFRSALPSSWMCIGVGIAWQVAIIVLAFLHGIVALDRYVFIVHPMKYQVYVTIKRTLIMVGAIFLTAGSVPGFLLLSGTQFVYSAPAMTCVGPSYWPIIFLGGIFLPSFAVTLFSYQRMWNVCANHIRQNVTERPHTSSLASSIIVASENVKTIEVLQHGARSSAKHDIFVGSETPVDPASIEMKNMTMSTMTSPNAMLDKKKKVANLTTFTTISGAPPVALPQVSGANDRIDAQSESIVNSKRILNSPFETPKNLKTSRRPQQLSPCDSKQNNIFHSMASGSSEKISRTAQLSVLMPPLSPHTLYKTPQSSKNPQNPEDLPDIVNVKSLTPPAKLNKPDRPEGTSVLKWATIANPVLSMMLIHEWSSPDDNNTCPIYSYLQNFFPALPQKRSPEQHQTQSQQKQIVAYGQKQRLRACLMVMFPVCGMVACFLPLIFCLLYWEYDSNALSDLSVILCHLFYAMTPSIVSLFLSLSNKPYRVALTRQICHCLPRH